MKNLDLWKKLFFDMLLSALIIMMTIGIYHYETDQTIKKILAWFIAILILGIFLEIEVHLIRIKKNKREEINKLKKEFKRWYSGKQKKYYEEYWVGLEKLTLSQIKSEVESETKIGKRILKEIKKSGGVKNAFESPKKEPRACCPAIKEAIPG